MTSYNSIYKWATEAKKLLREGNLDGVKTSLSMIQLQSKEEINKSKKDQNAR